MVTGFNDPNRELVPQVVLPVCPGCTGTDVRVAAFVRWQVKPGGHGSPARHLITKPIARRTDMDKDRIAGSAKVVTGKVKEAAGKVVGDAKLQTEGQAQQAEGKVQNAVGGVKDAVKDAVKDK